MPGSHFEDYIRNLGRIHMAEFIDNCRAADQFWLHRTQSARVPLSDVLKSEIRLKLSASRRRDRT
ncbi:MAG: hypothetical protein ACT4N2_07710 [Hyphomicrobium sp.]